MKNTLLVLLLMVAGAMSLKSQNQPDGQKILLTDSNDDTILLDLDNAAGPMVFVVYGPGCGICIKELNAISKKLMPGKTCIKQPLSPLAETTTETMGAKFPGCKRNLATLSLYSSTPAVSWQNISEIAMASIPNISPPSRTTIL